jgi:hypothetical protein
MVSQHDRVNACQKKGTLNFRGSEADVSTCLRFLPFWDHIIGADSCEWLSISLEVGKKVHVRKGDVCNGAQQLPVVISRRHWNGRVRHTSISACAGTPTAAASPVAGRWQSTQACRTRTR